MNLGMAVTLNDFRARMGSLDKHRDIINVLAQSNPILEDMKFMEGNLPTGIQTTRWTSLPEPSIRRINRGVEPSKGTTEQIVDTCMMLEDRSLVDVKIASMQNDAREFRKAEDEAHVEGFGQKVAKVLFYGDSMTNPDEFNGLSVRYSNFSDEKGKIGFQTVSGGTAGVDCNTSAYLVGWGDRHTVGIYPKGSDAGIKAEDLGATDVYDSEGRPFRAFQTLFSWNVGLCVRDFRSNAVVRNIDVNSLPTTAAGRLALVEKFIVARNRIRNLHAAGVNYVWYVSDSMYNFLETYFIDKNNVHVTRQDLSGKPPMLYLSGIPVKKVDAISETEKAIV